LTVEEGSKAARLARVDRLAVNVFGDIAKAHRWLRKPKTAPGRRDAARLPRDGALR
jgi:uncharacterized protein (DUF2384 family)